VYGDAESEIPIWRMISATLQSLTDRAENIKRRLDPGGIAVDLLETKSKIGGGSLPGQEQPSIAVAITARHGSIAETARKLRIGTPGVFGRIVDNRLLLDLRTVLPEEDDDFGRAVASALSDEHHL
jgi:L-seryl-tRNA(Ser) seleniumtransferase